jgi:hypothetical protein
MATDPIFFSTPKASMGAISAANTNRDGTGTLVTIVTAASNGSKVERIIIQATGTTTAGFVRLYIHDGTTARLFREIAVTAATPSATVAAFRAEVDCSVPSSLLVMQTGYSLRASTHNAESFNVIAIGADA